MEFREFFTNRILSHGGSNIYRNFDFNGNRSLLTRIGLYTEAKAVLLLNAPAWKAIAAGHHDELFGRLSR